MRILHVTDLHYFKPHFEWVSQVQCDYDVICLSGDFLDVSIKQVDNQDTQIQWIKCWTTSINVPLFMCSGNHDEVIVEDNMDLEKLFAFNEDDYCDPDYDLNQSSDFTAWLTDIPSSSVYSDGSIKTVGGVKFGCIPYGCDSFDRYHDCDVILYHVPPSKLGVAMENGCDRGCLNIRSALDSKALSPAWLLCGHIHKPLENISKYSNVSISNPGASIRSAKPLHYVLDIDNQNEVE